MPGPGHGNFHRISGKGAGDYPVGNNHVGILALSQASISGELFGGGGGYLLYEITRVSEKVWVEPSRILQFYSGVGNQVSGIMITVWIVLHPIYDASGYWKKPDSSYLSQQEGTNES